ncbi:hypothetical protein RND81_02G136100 [Saponaria officinalis]|uniref:Pentatricopeptide repeat-containing protein n=1 Tax=Saponaria officinalis TaxID=3572 RepID=A0AAW1MMN8_SAPOF
MEVSSATHKLTITAITNDPISENIKKSLLQKGVQPTPKIIHILRKKHHQKSLRKSKKLASNSPIEPLTQSQIDTLSHELHFKNIVQEYNEFTKTLDYNPPLSSKGSNDVVGKPWENLGTVNFAEKVSGYLIKEPTFGGKLKSEHLKDLGLVFEGRKFEALSTFLDDDVEIEEGSLEGENGGFSPFRKRVTEAQAIKILVLRLTAREITMKDWKFTRMMKQSALQFTEVQMLKIVGGIGDRGCWRQAMEVVEWVYTRKEHRHYKSRFVYTKLLSVLQKGRRPHEALRIFNHMRGDGHIYPDMAAYHSIAVTLGQAGMVRELMSIIECMKEKPSKSAKNMRQRNWDPTLQPDVVIFNSVLNACVPTQHWKGVAWVFQELRKGGLQANSATYGLAMEVMQQSSKYDQVHQLFEKMKKSGKSPNALTYKVLVRTFWKESKVDEAVNIVRKMEQCGVMGSASVYYELACCLCNKGRWEEAMIEIQKLKKLRHSRPLAVTFTGMILSSMDGGHVDNCISLYDEMQNYCRPNIGTVNAMLKVYGRNDMFLEAKELFEKAERSVKGDTSCSGDENTSLVPDTYTYSTMLEISGRAQQWEYFEYVYKEMCLNGYRLDQEKQAGLLVEASKAGKWHLLEHFFNTALEAAEIPDPMLFAEMLCQSMIQYDFEKAVTMVSTMAYAPFQFNKDDWVALFDKNNDRISNDHLQKLSETLTNRDMPEESTVLELLKALQSVYGSRANVAIINSSNCDGDATDNKSLDGRFNRDKVSVGPSGEWNTKYDSEGDDECPSSVDDMTCDEHDYNAFDELHSPVDSDSEEAEDREDPELPSAEEILQTWMEMRKDDESRTHAKFATDAGFSY